jgi:transcription initiation factor TFIIIB Brf1 subunit/transcription initiation factor TFIIB
MSEKCSECGSEDFRTDDEKAECVCEDCGFVMPAPQNNEMNNSSNLYGEQRTHERVTSRADLGGTYQRTRSQFDHAGQRINPAIRRSLNYGSQRTQERERNPQLREVKEAITYLVGEDAMLSIERIIDACIQPYSEEDNAKIRALEQARRKDKNLKNVAQSVNRISDDFFSKRGEENRSTAGPLNNYLLAMAILEWASNLGLIQRVQLDAQRESFGLPEDLVNKAKQIVDKCLKAQMRNGLRCNGLRFIADRHNKDLMVANRDDDFTVALKMLIEALSDHGIDDDILESMNNDIEQRMNILQEASLYGPLTNHPAKKIMAMLVYVSLEAHVGSHRCLTLIAEEVSMTAQGLANFIHMVRVDRALLPLAYLVAVLAQRIASLNNNTTNDDDVDISEEK